MSLIKKAFFFALSSYVRLLASGPSPELEQLNANNDDGFWLAENFTTEIYPKWFITLHGDQRWGSNYKLFWYFRQGVILQYDLTEWIQNKFCISKESIFKGFTLGPGFNQYCHIDENTLGRFKWAWISRTIFDANLKLFWKKWELYQRFRFEYKDNNSTHYKNSGDLKYRIWLNTPWKWTDFHLNPYISNEFFFRQNTYRKATPNGLVGGLYQNRLQFGFNVDFWENITLNVYWQLRSLKQTPSTHPRYFNTYDIGININKNI